MQNPGNRTNPVYNNSIHPNTVMYSVEHLRERLVQAGRDAISGRTMTCEEVHENLEKKFPWLCE